jgi:hypothetical protein
MTLGVLGCSARTFVAFPGARDGAFSSDPPTPAPDAGNTSDSTVAADLATVAADLATVATDLSPVPSHADAAGLSDLTPVPTNADVAGLADLAPDATGGDAPVPPDLLPFDLPALLDRPGESVADLPPADRLNADVRPDASRDTSDGAANGPVVLFYDGFDDGFAANWSSSEPSDGPVTDTTDGSNKIATLDATQTENARLRCNLDGSHFTGINISASMKVRIDRAPTSTRTVRLDVRQASSTVNIFYAVGVTVAANDGTMTKVSIIKKVADGSGNYTECELAAGTPLVTAVAMGNWRTIKLTIAGDTSVKLTASFEGTTMATFTDDCSSPLISTNNATVPNGGCLAGQTGLGIQVEKGIKASVDDVLVTAPVVAARD